MVQKIDKSELTSQRKHQFSSKHTTKLRRKSVSKAKETRRTKSNYLIISPANFTRNFLPSKTKSTETVFVNFERINVHTKKKAKLDFFNESNVNIREDIRLKFKPFLYYNLGDGDVRKLSTISHTFSPLVPINNYYTLNLYNIQQYSSYDKKCLNINSGVTLTNRPYLFNLDYSNKEYLPVIYNNTKGNMNRYFESSSRSIKSLQKASKYIVHVVLASKTEEFNNLVSKNEILSQDDANQENNKDNSDACNVQSNEMDEVYLEHIKHIWLKSGLRQHFSNLSNMKLKPEYESEEVHLPDTANEPLPVLGKIDIKPIKPKKEKVAASKVDKTTPLASPKDTESKESILIPIRKELTDMEKNSQPVLFNKLEELNKNQKFEIQISCSESDTNIEPALSNVEVSLEEINPEFTEWLITVGVPLRKISEHEVQTSTSSLKEHAKIDDEKDETILVNFRKHEEVECECKNIKIIIRSASNCDKDLKDYKISFCGNKLVLTVPQERNTALQTFKRKLQEIFSGCTEHSAKIKNLKITTHDNIFEIIPQNENYTSETVHDSTHDSCSNRFEQHTSGCSTKNIENIEPHTCSSIEKDVTSIIYDILYRPEFNVVNNCTPLKKISKGSILKRSSSRINSSCYNIKNHLLQKLTEQEKFCQKKTVRIVENISKSNEIVGSNEKCNIKQLSKPFKKINKDKLTKINHSNSKCQNECIRGINKNLICAKYKQKKYEKKEKTKKILIHVSPEENNNSHVSLNESKANNLPQKDESLLTASNTNYKQNEKIISRYHFREHLNKKPNLKFVTKYNLQESIMSIGDKIIDLASPNKISIPIEKVLGEKLYDTCSKTEATINKKLTQNKSFLNKSMPVLDATSENQEKKIHPKLKIKINGKSNNVLKRNNTFYDTISNRQNKSFLVDKKVRKGEKDIKKRINSKSSRKISDIYSNCSCNLIGSEFSHKHIYKKEKDNDLIKTESISSNSSGGCFSTNKYLFYCPIQIESENSEKQSLYETKDSFASYDECFYNVKNTKSKCFNSSQSKIKGNHSSHYNTGITEYKHLPNVIGKNDMQIILKRSSKYLRRKIFQQHCYTNSWTDLMKSNRIEHSGEFNTSYVSESLAKLTTKSNTNFTWSELEKFNYIDESASYQWIIERTNASTNYTISATANTSEHSSIRSTSSKIKSDVSVSVNTITSCSNKSFQSEARGYISKISLAVERGNVPLLHTQGKFYRSHKSQFCAEAIKHDVMIHNDYKHNVHYRSDGEMEYKKTPSFFLSELSLWKPTRNECSGKSVKNSSDIKATKSLRENQIRKTLDDFLAIILDMSEAYSYALIECKNSHSETNVGMDDSATQLSIKSANRMDYFGHNGSQKICTSTANLNTKQTTQTKSNQHRDISNVSTSSQNSPSDLSANTSSSSLKTSIKSQDRNDIWQIIKVLSKLCPRVLCEYYIHKILK